VSSPGTYQRARTIFLVASRLPHGERTRYLGAQCAGDVVLEKQVRRLLSADEEDPGFLESPAMELQGRAHAPGDRLGHFRILHPLGEGGMGVVYEAQQDEPSRRVALKLVRAGLFSARLRSRFRHEIRILGQLRHPGIAQIYEAGTLELSGEQVPYFAMELVEGSPLLETARQHRLGVRERLLLIAQVCDAVHHAHQKGVIHRDLKPGNILVEEAPTTDGSGDPLTALPLQVKVLDFGIARAVDPQTPLASMHTEAGQIIGTIPYLSPEQAAGDPSAMDVRSDIYSIGVIAYELLSGRLPYDLEGRSLAAAALAIRDVEPPSLGSLDRTLRGDVETIVAKALQKDATRRYQSAADFAADVRHFLRDEPILARPASALYKMGKFARRHRAGVVAGLLVILAMAAATAFSLRQAGIATRARHFAEGQKTRADAGAAAAERQARRASLAAAAAAVHGDDPITARKFLEGIPEAGRGWPWQYWHGRLDQSVAVMSPGQRIAGAWFSADAQEAVLVLNDGSMVRGSPWAGGGLAPAAPLERAPVRAADFTADGALVAAICGEQSRELCLFDARNGRLIRELPALDAAGNMVALSADGEVVCVGIRRIPKAALADELWVVRAADGWVPHRILQDGADGVALSDDGTRLASGFLEPTVWETATGAQRVLGTLGQAGLRFAWARDAALLASGGEDRTLRVWDGASGDVVRSIRGHAGEITAVAFDPTSRLLASASNDLTIRVWDPITGRPIRTLAGHQRPPRWLRFAPGPEAVLASISDDGSARLWALDPDEGTTILRGHSSYVYSVAFSADGSRLYSAGWDFSVRAWDVAGGAPAPGVIVSGDLQKGYVTAMAVSPDGRLIVTGHKTERWGRAPARVWAAATGEMLHELGSGAWGVCDIRFNADGSRVWIVWDHDGVYEFDLTATPPARRRIVDRTAPRSLALLQDGRELLVGRVDGIIVRIDAQTGRELGRLEGHRAGITGLAVHPRLPLLASASMDGTARLWDLDTGRCTAMLEGHWDKVYALAFSPDGQILATGSDDTTILIWDVQHAEELTRLRGHEAYVYSLAFSPDGSRLASGSGDGTVRVWDTHPAHERWRARRAVPGLGH
jgi:eukaryotic-like serine/threonine-protein kinase